MKSCFTSDFHFDHSNILKYCGRLEFMSPRERDEYLLLKETQDRDGMKRFRLSRESTERMNVGIIAGLNAVAGPDDVIWCLGDVFFGDNIERLWALRKKIVCRHINLVFGNHDKNIKRWHRYYRMGQSTRTPEMVVKLRQIIDDLANGALAPGRALQLANKIEVYNPLEGIFDFIFDYAKVNVDGQEVFLNHFAQAVWDKSHHGVWHLYGHSHANFEPWRETHLVRAKMIDVGIDYRFQLGYGWTPWTMPELAAWMRKREGQSVDHHGDADG